VGKIAYLKCNGAEPLMYRLSEAIGIKMKAKIAVIVSKGAKARAYARIYGLPSAIQVGHTLPPLYTVEFICEKSLKLSEADLTEVAIHELMHIPEGQRGGLRPHGKKVNAKITRSLLRRVDEELMKELQSSIKKCCLGSK